MSEEHVKTHDERPGLVVVGTDASDDAQRAVVFGLRSAMRRDADLLLVNAVDDALMAGSWGVVYDPEVLQRAGQAACETARQFAIDNGFPEHRIRTDVLLGSPGAVLTRLSEVADLIVVGRRATSGLERMFVGSTSVSVVGAASCPVVVVSAASNPEPTGQHGVVGVGLNANPSSTSTIEAGFDQARLRGTRLELIHAVQLPMGLFAPKSTPEQIDQHVEFSRGGIEAMIAQLREKYPDVETTVRVVADTPLNELLSRSEHLDLLVLGVPHSNWPGFSLGGLIRGMLAHARCPLYLTK